MPRKTVTDANNLAALNPVVAREWHPTTERRFDARPNCQWFKKEGMVVVPTRPRVDGSRSHEG